jgi:hypothetical protein
MAQIHFQTVVGPDQVIRPPAGINLPEGPIEVIVQSPCSAVSQEETGVHSTQNWLLSLAAEAERLAPSLPADLAEHHDFYAHGKRGL